jgi:riboflavin kinase/FMN adenylyltransferase
MQDFLGDVFELPVMPPAVICVGKFDAVHLGHQELLRQAKAKAASYSLPLLVMCFFPHPATLFTNDPPLSLTNVQQRVALLKLYGADCVICLDFNCNLANLSASSFMQQILLDKLQAKVVVVGKDFRFGKARLGGVNELSLWGKKEAVEVVVAQDVMYKNKRVSTSWCREVVDDPVVLSKLLGRSKLIK